MGRPDNNNLVNERDRNMTKAEALIIEWVAAGRAELAAQLRVLDLDINRDPSLEARQDAHIEVCRAKLATSQIERRVVALADELEGEVKP